jgi:branched-chain amino acid transport system permease protein
MGLVAGAIAIRRQGIYFAMVTLALSQMVFFFCLQAKFTGGDEDGIQAIPRRPLLGFIDIRNDCERRSISPLAASWIGVPR